ncbi:Nucleotidyltransferase domain protein [Bacteroidales bacterium Barb6XT]|nr:Nucleotidyltransferase domain protein [Bacteroidales bacterium Barb6XT]
MEQRVILNLLGEFKRLHGAEYGITRIGIFGSVARGEQTAESDVDIYFEAPPMCLFTLVHLKHELEDVLKAPVDVFRKHSNMRPRFVQRIEKEVIYV